MKTVLAPNAPWPKYEPVPEKPKFKHEQKPVRVIKPKVKATTKIKQTNDNFERWLESEGKKHGKKL